MILHRGKSSSSYTSVYCIIPARAGSKGLPHKNSLLLNGLPLAEHSLLFASLLYDFNDIVFTTDCPLLFSRSNIYPSITYHLRDAFLSSDESTLVEVVFHLYDTLLSRFAGSNPAFILLQPTSPYRCLKEIRRAIQFAVAEGLDSLVSVSSVHCHPSECIEIAGDRWNYIVTPPNKSTRRQDYTVTPYFISGSFYLASLHHLVRYNSFLSPDTSFFKTSEPCVVDIDSPDDFEVARALYALMNAAGFASPYSSY